MSDFLFKLSWLGNAKKQKRKQGEVKTLKGEQNGPEHFLLAITPNFKTQDSHGQPAGLMALYG
jgi:hypothetical protein